MLELLGFLGDDFPDGHVYRDVHEVESYPASFQQQILETYTDQVLNGTGPVVAAALERLHAQTRADEMMLVVTGYSRQAQARTVELIADHYGISSQ